MPGEPAEFAVAETQTLSMKLEVGAVNASTVVNEEVPLIETSNASNGEVIDTQKLGNLPNLGRNPFLLSKLTNTVMPVGGTNSAVASAEV